MSYKYSTYKQDNDDLLSDGDEDLGDFPESDTEDASETESQSNRNEEPIEIKEQMYQHKLANLKEQLEELKNKVHPEYIRRIKKIEHEYQERLRINEIYRDYLMECVEKDYIFEKNAAAKEYEEKKNDLQENLISDYEEKRKIIEAERYSMELTGDSVDSKPTSTRKLRRRPNDPLPVVDQKRRKPTNGQLNYLLEDKDIESDLKLISRGSNSHSMKMSMGNMSPAENGQSMYEARIEDGKLLYDRRWFHRGQSVTVEGRDIQRISGIISAITSEVVWVNRLMDENKFENKVKIHLKQLQAGKITIKRRAS